MGEKVYERELESGLMKHSIQMNDAANGLYFLKLYTSKGIILKRFVVNK